jgi:hypothetical protein
VVLYQLARIYTLVSAFYIGSGAFAVQIETAARWPTNR